MSSILAGQAQTGVSYTDWLAIIGRADRPRQRFSRLFATLRLWRRRHVERARMARDLESFTPAMLEDFDMTRAEAQAMAERPFWRA
jgi:uncharacterized protein YjiS (DUF1127 family)